MQGKRVVITGATRGIGLTTARMFLEQGARVAFCGINGESVDAAQEELSEYGDVYGAVADVRDAEAVSHFVTFAVEHLGGIDVLVNNAGVAYSGPFAEESTEDIEKLVSVNVTGVLLMSRVALPHLQETDGVIVNVASGAGLSGIPELTTYSATKFAVVGFTEALAQELKGRVRVYAVCPGRVATSMQPIVSGERVGMSPERVAEHIQACISDNPPIQEGECLVIHE